MKKMTTIVMVLLAAAALAIAQTTAPQPVNGGQTTTAQPNDALNCAPGADLVRFSDWNSGTVREACLETNGQVRQRIVAYISSVNQIMPLGRYGFYTYSGSGKLTQITMDTAGSITNWLQWRIPGNGSVSYAPGESSAQVLLTLPWDYEKYNFWLYGAESDYQQRVYENLPQWCSAAALLVPSGYNLCLDVRAGQVTAAKNNLIGSPEHVAIYAANDSATPVGMTAEGDTAYVLLGNQYVYSDIPSTPGLISPSQVIPGKLIAISAGYDGVLKTDTAINGLDVDSDALQQRIAASHGAIYIIASARNGNQRGNQILKYNLSAKKVSIFLPIDDNGFANAPFLSGLTVAPVN